MSKVRFLVRPALVLALFACLASTAVTAAQPVHAASLKPTESPTGSLPDIGFGWKQQVASSRLRDFLAADPTANGGLSSTSPHDVTVHFLLGHTPSAGYLGQIELAQAAGVTVGVDSVARSQAVLTQLAGQACHGPQFRTTVVTYCAADFDSNKVRIGVLDPAKVDRAAAAQASGGLVEVVHMDQAVNAGRDSDYAPFYGGDDIAVSTGGCTAGFTMTDRYGNDYMITAGHCFGEDVTGQPAYTEPAYNPFGTEYFTLYTSACWPPGTDSCFDAAIVGGQGRTDVTYDGRVWIGGLNTTVSQGVAGATDVNVGTPMYFAGSRSGQILVKVTSGAYCNFDSDTVWTCGIQNVQAVKSGQNACQGGDSGGPVYGPAGNGKVVAVGIIKACNGTGGGEFVRITSILNAFASTIKLG